MVKLIRLFGKGIIIGMGFFIGIMIVYATTRVINSVTNQTINKGDQIGSGWFQEVNDKVMSLMNNKAEKTSVNSISGDVEQNSSDISKLSGDLNKILSIGSQYNPGLSCKDILDTNPNTSGDDGTYWIDPDGEGGESVFEVYCDMTTDGGGWILLAKTATNSLSTAEKDIIRKGTWNDYTVTGYGSPESSSNIYWMPLEKWHTLTSTYPNNIWRIKDSSYELGAKNLSIESNSNNYAINWDESQVGDYDCMRCEPYVSQDTKTMSFTTYDRDNDTRSDNCAIDNVGYNGGFWYNYCYQNSMLHNDGNIYSRYGNTDFNVSYMYHYFRETN